MLKKIKIKNFKSLEDFEIEVKPLMLLFGQNSSGKSTFLKALMFLNQNLFPLNNAETNYFINNTVDLISYKDIVFKNEIKRDITFELFFDGCYDFPLVETLNKEFYKTDEFILLMKESNVNKYDAINHEYIKDTIDSIINKLSELNILNFYEYFHEVFNDIGLNSPNLDEDNILSFKLIIEFSDNHNSENLRNIKFIDELNNITLSFKKDYEGFTLNDFNYANNENISQLIKHKLFEPYKYFQYPSFPSFEDFNRKNLNIDINDYWKIMNFFYLAYTFIPFLVRGFLSYKHLPSLREIPENIYLLNKRNSVLVNNQYYGLLSDLAKEQIRINNFFADVFENNNIVYSDIEYIINLIDQYQNNTITPPERKKLYAFTEQYFISNPELEESNIEVLNKFTIIPIANSIEKKVDRFIDNSIFRINQDLRKCGISDIFLILYDSNFETAKLILLSNPGTLIYLSNASSGLIQLLPIISFINVLKMNDNIFNFTLEDNIQYIHKSLIPFNDNEINTLFIEQPELHLHPKLQCKIANLFTDMVLKKDVYFCAIIETHSEHFIRSIQLDIARGKFNANLLDLLPDKNIKQNIEFEISRKDLIGVYYFYKVDGITKLKILEMDNNGLFKEPWPDGFFDDSVNLTMDIYEALRTKNN